MTQPGIPLEIKTLIIRELSPYGSESNPRYTPVSGDEKAAYFCDLCTVCLVWPDTIAIIRQIIFERISLHANDRHIDSSLRNLCQALENDPNLSTFVAILEFSHRNSNGSLPQNSPFIPTASRPLFLSFLSFIPKMHKLRFLCLDHMHFHNETSIELNDLRILKESSVTHLTLRNSTFSIAAFNVFLAYWEDMVLTELCVDSISLIPHTTYTSDQMSLEIEEDTWDWDEEDTWTEWEVDKPRTTSFLFVSDLEMTLVKSLGCGILMLMDFLASDEWSPFIDVDNLQIFAGGSAMTATTVIRINNLIRRYELSFLWLDDFTNFEDATGTPLHLGGVKCSEMDFSILEGFVFDELDEDRFEWYVESLAAVPPNSRLRQLTLRLTILVPLEAKDLGSQGVWGILDSALSGNNLQLATLIIDVSPTISPTCSKTRGLKELLETWLMKTCFPKVAAKYSRQNKETAGEKKTSLLALWIGGEQFYAKKQ